MGVLTLKLICLHMWTTKPSARFWDVVRGRFVNFKHFSSESPMKDLKNYVVLTDDSSTFVCWHPERPFPYECSRPLPEYAIESNSVLNVQNNLEVREVFKPKSEEVVRQELMNLTHTTKHIWFPRARDKRAKKTPPDREFL